METRPKIIIEPTPLDNALEVSGRLLLAVMWGLTIYVFVKSPDVVPTHFNAAGKIDGYGSRATFLIMPVIATAIYWGMTQLGKYPHLFNYATKITEQNARRQYAIAVRLLLVVGVAILLIFSVLILCVYLAGIGMGDGLTNWFLPLLISLLSIPTLIAVIYSIRKK